MLQNTGNITESIKSRLLLKQAATDKEIESAMKLRFEVFNLELNEGLQSSYLTGIDTDQYDKSSDHIIVIDTAKDMVVGTYRLLAGSKAEKGMGFYSETEFEMSSFKKLDGEKLELGRACVHRDYRGSAVLNLMWAGIARYIERYNISYLFGCGSIHNINPYIVSSVYSFLWKNYMADERFKVTPLKKVPDFDPELTNYDKGMVTKHVPQLLFAYLRLGARICGEPAFDEQFGVSDFLIILDRSKLIDRYKKHYMSCML